MAPACDAQVLSVCYGFPISHGGPVNSQARPLHFTTSSRPVLVMNPTICRSKGRDVEEERASSELIEVLKE